MRHLRRLVREIHRRSLWQVLAAYVPAFWVAFEVVQTLTEGLGLPQWLPLAAFLLLLLGLPVVLVTAFVQEGGPDFSIRDPSLLPGFEEEEPAGPLQLRLRRLLTWRNALGVPAVVFMFLGVGTAGFVGTRALGVGPAGSLLAKGVLQQGDRVILADFEGHGVDSLLAVTMTEAYRIAFTESDEIRVVRPDQVRATLRRMQRDENSRLDYELAREVALRETDKAVLAGEVARLGGSFVLSARLVAARSGETLLTHRETARDSAELIPAVDRLVRKFRRRIGDPLRAIQQTAPLPEVTTASLPALQKYAAAINETRAGRRPQPLLEEAVALDSTFASAIAYLALRARNARDWRRARPLISRAYRLRARLTEAERYDVEALYPFIMTGEVDTPIQKYQRMVEVTDSMDTGALISLAWLLSRKNDFARSEELYRKALEVDPSPLIYVYIIETQILRGQLEEARATQEAWSENLPESVLHWVSGELALLRGEVEAVERHLAEAWPRYLAGLRARQGRLAEAERIMAELREQQDAQGEGGPYLVNAFTTALLEAWVAGGAEEGMGRVERALERYPLEELEPDERPYLQLASFYSLVGQPVKAREALEGYEHFVPLEVRDRPDLAHERTAGAVLIAEGRVAEAIEHLRPHSRLHCLYNTHGTWCALPLLGLAYERAGMPDSALDAYTRYLAPALDKQLWGDTGEAAFGDVFWLPFIHERLAELHEERGEPELAAHYLGKLIEQWQDADPVLQPRVEAARGTLQWLLGEVD